MFYRHGMRVMVIPRERVEKFRKRVFKYGIDYWSVYPDAVGLGQQLRWFYQNKVSLGSIFIKNTSASFQWRPILIKMHRTSTLVGAFAAVVRRQSGAPEQQAASDEGEDS